MTDILYISDTHYERFNRFASVDTNTGLNTRLLHTIDATKEAVEFAVSQGVKTLVHGGDCFHVRGKISPLVLNPVLELYRWIIEEKSMNVYMISGNHDLESKDADALSSAASALSAVGVNVINQCTPFPNEKLFFVPWFSSIDRVNKELADFKDIFDPSEYTAVIHAPMNGVIAGIPDHGLDPGALTKHGFKRIMCGHYHNHKSFDGGKVISIGSLTHQNFGDIHSKAGYIIQQGDMLSHLETSAPKFVSIDDDSVTSQDEFEELVAGNFVRAQLTDATEQDVAELKADLKKAGALDSLITNIKSTTPTARTSSAGASVSMHGSVSNWVKTRGFGDVQDDVEKAALSILSEI